MSPSLRNRFAGRSLLRSPVQLKLRLEWLEGREVPSVTWLGTDPLDPGDPLDPYNWSSGQVPGDGADLEFDGTQSNVDFTSSPTQTGFHSVHLIRGYSGTVTFTGGLWTNELELRSGAIGQPSTPDGTDITISGQFTWTGGTLNNTGHQANLFLEGGATATVAPGVGNTLTTGSNLDFQTDVYTQAGSTGTFTAGTLNWGNGTAYTIEHGSQVSLDLTGGDIDFEAGGGGGGGADPPNCTIAGELKVFDGSQTPGKFYTETRPLYVLGGDVQITNRATVQITGALPTDKVQYLQENVGTWTATTTMEGYTKIKTADTGIIYLHSGVLNLKVAGGGGVAAGTCFLDGKAWLGGAGASSGALTITSSDPDPTHTGTSFVAVQLLCSKDAWMGGTTIQMRVDPDGLHHDAILVTGELMLGDYNRIEPNPSNVTPGNSYNMIGADGGIMFDEDENPEEHLPAVDSGLWTIELQHDGVTGMDWIWITSISD